MQSELRLSKIKNIAQRLHMSKCPFERLTFSLDCVKISRTILKANKKAMFVLEGPKFVLKNYVTFASLKAVTLMLYEVVYILSKKWVQILQKTTFYSVK